MARVGPMMALVIGCAMACGPGRQSGDTNAETTTSTGTNTASSGADDTGAVEDSGDSDSTSGTDTGADMGAPEECVIAIRLDQCCNSPVAALSSEIAEDECLVAWPVDSELVPPEVLIACWERAPQICEILDCAPAPPASMEVTFDTAGRCQFVCPPGEFVGFAEAGCGGPGPVSVCSPPPPPCADEYCSCAGETVYGCGVLFEPWDHMGAC